MKTGRFWIYFGEFLCLGLMAVAAKRLWRSYPALRENWTRHKRA